jgi:thiol-disulfide isomerase/thioredoxin
VKSWSWWLVFAAACNRPDPCARARPEGPLAWFSDDLPGAGACAKTKNVPIVIDLWAPWCHTCLAMRTVVFQDPSFAAERDRFVFVALDTDREINAPALTKLTASAWPTFYVLDPEHQDILARFVGAATVEQFHDLLTAGTRARAGGAAAVDARMLGGERALAAKDYVAAAQELAAALGQAAPSWSRRREAMYDLLLAQARNGDHKACVQTTDEGMVAIGNDAIATNFLDVGWECVKHLVGEDQALAPPLRDRIVARWRDILADPSATLSVDDRAEALGFLRDALEQMRDHEGAVRIAEQARALLDDAAAKAGSPLAAMTYNWPRADVYAFLGRPLELVPALEQSARDLPTEYDPRARLGWIYWKGGKLPEAAKWTDEALALVYGPRKGRLLEQRAEIAAAAADTSTERRLRKQAVELYESLPTGQQVPETLAKARAALARLEH